MKGNEKSGKERNEWYLLPSRKEVLCVLSSAILHWTLQGRINLRFNNRDHHGGLHKAVLNGKEADVEHLLSSGKGNCFVKTNNACP